MNSGGFVSEILLTEIKKNFCAAFAHLSCETKHEANNPNGRLFSLRSF